MDPLAKKFDRYRRHGDLRALGEVFDALAPRLLPVAMHLCGNPADAEDALQEAFVLAMRRAETFDPKRRLEPWLAGFLTNTARSAARRERRRMTEALPELASGEEGPMAAAEREELVAALRTRVDELPSEQRQVLMLQLQHGLAPAEIAEVLEVPAGTVRMRLHRGLAALRRLLPAGFAAWLFGALPSRGLAAVRQAVMQAGKEQAVAAGAAVAAVSAVGGVLAMKKLMVGGLTLMLLGLLWWWCASPSPTLSSAAGDVDIGSRQTARVEAGPAPAAGATEADATGWRTEVAAPTGSLRIRVVATVPAQGGAQALAVPMAGVLLQVWPGESRLPPFQGLVHDLATLGAGSVSLGGLTPGPWQVQLVADGATTAARVDPGVETLVDIVQTASGVARGIVVDADGQPVPDAELWLYRGVSMGRYDMPERGQLISRLADSSDADGRFAVALLSRESSLGAAKAGFGESFARYVQLDRGELRLVLGRESAAVSGTVRDPSGQAVVGAFVTLTPPGQDSRRAEDGTMLAARVVRQTRTDREGRFCFAGTAPGKHRLAASAWPLCPAWCELDLAAAAEQVCDLELKPNVSVVGTIRYADGSPACAGLHSTPERTLNGHYCTCAAREDGSFHLYYQPCRTFWVIARWRNQVLAEREFTDPQPGVIHCDFVLDQLLPLQGRVVDEQGQALEQWQVKAEGTGVRAEAATDATGSFRFGIAVGQQLKISVIPLDGDWSVPALVRDLGNADGQALELRVPVAAVPIASVHGRLVGPDGAGLADRMLLLHPRGHAWPQYRRLPSDAGGRFVIERLSAGALTLALANDSEAGAEIASFALAAGQQLDLGNLVIEPPAILDIDFTRADGSPWRGVPPAVGLFDAAGGRAALETSERPGGVRLLAKPGSYRVQVVDSDLLAEPQPVELAAGSTRTLRLPVGVGRTRELVFNGDGNIKPDLGTPLHVTVRRADGSTLLQQDVTDLYPDLRGFRYWYLYRAFPFGRYQVEASADAGQRYRASFEVRESLEDPTRVDVPLVAQ